MVRRQNVKDIDWNLLKSFITLAGAPNLTIGADMLGRSQPAVSQALARLEDQLACKLIDRRHGRFDLTEAGKIVLVEAKAMQASLHRLVDLIERPQGELRGVVRIAVTSRVVSPVFDAFLQDFCRAHPGVALEILVDPSRSNEMMVLRQDVAVAICLSDCTHPDLGHQKLYTEQFGFYCGRGHPLYGHSAPSQAMMKNAAIVKFTSEDASDVLRELVRFRVKSALIGPTIAKTADQEEVMRLVRLGLGVGPVPRHVIAQEADPAAYWQIPVKHKLPEITTYVLWNLTAERNAVETVFLDRLLGHLSDPLPSAN